MGRHRELYKQQLLRSNIHDADPRSKQNSENIHRRSLPVQRNTCYWYVETQSVNRDHSFEQRDDNCSR